MTESAHTTHFPLVPGLMEHINAICAQAYREWRDKPTVVIVGVATYWQLHMENKGVNTFENRLTLTTDIGRLFLAIDSRNQGHGAVACPKPSMCFDCPGAQSFYEWKPEQPHDL